MTKSTASKTLAAVVKSSSAAAPSASYDLVAQADALKSHMQEFYLNPEAWTTLPTVATAPSWKKVRYDVSSKSKIPAEPGLYIFVLEPISSSFPLPPHGYLLYIGKTGGDQSKSTLRHRFGEYLKEENDPKGRPAIVYMLRKWKDALHFHFTPISDKSIIGKMEDELIHGMKPPFNRQYVNIDLRQTMQAAFR
ncbi:MAG TPA: GIY-YIG nuclease family protein [Rhodanobacter sp.]|nr:GIY-YIG nuclease family protein [Rhodanobacter sp.]